MPLIGKTISWCRVIAFQSVDLPYPTKVSAPVGFDNLKIHNMNY